MHQHSVVEGEQVGLPALVYEYTGERDLLRASEAAWETMHAYLSPDGTSHSNEEMRLRGPRSNGEHCGAVEWIATSQIMTRVAGAVRYADAADRAVFNGYPGAKSADGMLVAYMHALNQLVAAPWSGPTWDDQDAGITRQYYSTAAGPLCCNVNGPRALPHFVAGKVLADERGPVVVHNGPSSATARTAAANGPLLKE